MPARDDGGRGPRVSSQRRATFVRNHAKAIVAADFLTVVTARFHVLYVFVVMEVGARKMLHFNETAYPSAKWTLLRGEARPAQKDQPEGGHGIGVEQRLLIAGTSSQEETLKR